ncbi:MAG: helix-turn-helix transcriptional regulator [Oscillospiraceae bacterium]|nr:helix-turn-helix transcriptional regulator [Oscillospiraceae bacterium]MCD7768223.1 helix-turn-helix transcriptional regulator [Oscillospiraceae bacterium]MCD7860290.1 helix-turn-helix transcriptional regulator [Oscillospiraceae bacterium]MCD8128962.1 helix-turn-helix transcriptional regulator [Oscillospiraceae bacterium]
MPRKSISDKKFLFQLRREELGLSREKAAILLNITPERLERIETGKSRPSAEDIKVMAEKYNYPLLRNDYCANICDVGKGHFSSLRIEELSQIVLSLLASLNTMEQEKNRFIEITVDGQISDDELDDFVKIQKKLKTIATTVDTLQLWIDNMCSNGTIDIEKYHEKLNQ